MTAKSTCNTCKFFDLGTTKAFPAADGMCRRYAPQGPVIGCETNGWQVFPPMTRHQWCGEWSAASGPNVIERMQALARAA